MGSSLRGRPPGSFRPARPAVLLGSTVAFRAEFSNPGKTLVATLASRGRLLVPVGLAGARYCVLVGISSGGGWPARWARGLLRCGLAAGPVFVTTFLAEGAVRDGYRPSRHPVSSLALGPGGRVQAANFAVTGTLVLAGAVGLGRARERVVSGQAVRALMGAAGAGLIGAAVFATDPVSGYPPGTPDAPAQPSHTGTIHNLVAVPVFVGLPAAAFTCGWRSARAGHRGFALYCAATATTMLATSALAGAGFGQSPRLVNRAGLLQRASIVTGFGWLTTLCARALRQAGRPGAAP